MNPLIPNRKTPTANNLSISITEFPKNKEITLFTLKGFMDTTTAPEFEKVFQTALSENKFKMVIDLSSVDYISSAGWGIFVSELKRIRNGKGDLVLAGMIPDVVEVFELLEFDSILKFFPDVVTAVQKAFPVKIHNPEVKKQDHHKT